MKLIVKRFIDGEAKENIVAFGINADLLLWLTSGESEFIKNFLLRHGITVRELFVIFGHGQLDEKRIQAIKLMKKIWTEHPEIGPIPLFDIFREYQEDKIFYDEYRDHISHQLYVFFLGLYVYCSNNDFEQKLNKEALIYSKKWTEDGGTAFLTSWIITSLYHDLGYLIETQRTNTEAQNHDKSFQILEEINKIQEFPVSHTPGFFNNKSDFRISDAKMLFKSNNHHADHFSKLEETKELSTYSGENLFENELINNYVIDTKLGPEHPVNKRNESSVLERYYRFRKDESIGREGYYDHGIASSLMLLRIWKTYQRYVAKLNEIAKTNSREGGFLKDKAKRLDKMNKKLLKYEDTIAYASAAISLHNIDLAGFIDNSELEYKVANKDLNLNFKICWKDIDNDINAKPLAYLLCFVDMLQMWNRPKFRIRQKTDKEIEILDQDISINRKDNKIFLFFKKDLKFNGRTHRTGSESKYGKLIKEMESILCPKGIETLLDVDLNEKASFDQILISEEGENFFSDIEAKKIKETSEVELEAECKTNCLESEENLELLIKTEKKLNNLLKKELNIEELTVCAQQKGTSKTCNMALLNLLAMAEHNRSLMCNLKAVKLSDYLIELHGKLVFILDTLSKEDDHSRVLTSISFIDIAFKKIKFLFQPSDTKKPSVNEYDEFDKHSQYNDYDENFSVWKRLEIYLEQRVRSDLEFQVEGLIKSLKGLEKLCNQMNGRINTFNISSDKDELKQMTAKFNFQSIQVEFKEGKQLLDLFIYELRRIYIKSITHTARHLFKKLEKVKAEEVCNQIVSTLNRAPDIMNMWPE